MVREPSQPYADWMKDMYPFLAAFAWHQYQKVGRGFLLVDLTESDELNEWTPVRYISVADAEAVGWFSRDETFAKNVREYDPTAGILVNFVLGEEEGKALGLGNTRLPPPAAYEKHKDDIAHWESTVN